MAMPSSNNSLPTKSTMYCNRGVMVWVYRSSIRGCKIKKSTVIVDFFSYLFEWIYLLTFLLLPHFIKCFACKVQVSAVGGPAFEHLIHHPVLQLLVTHIIHVPVQGGLFPHFPGYL